MAGKAGRDLLLKISDGGAPPQFHTLGAARMTAFDVINEASETTAVAGGFAATYAPATGQNLRVTLQGLFKDSQAEELLRTTALEPATTGYQMIFPNGDCYAADFVVESYRREGRHDDMEAFAVTLLRTGAGAWTSA